MQNLLCGILQVDLFVHIHVDEFLLSNDQAQEDVPSSDGRYFEGKNIFPIHEEFLRRKQAEMDTLREEISEAKRHALDFSVRREAEEQRLAGLISPFLSGQPNPVTVGNQPVELVKPNPSAPAAAAPTSGKPKA